ncbi:PD-(D/E)XK nuclease family protein [Lentzea sp. NPDC051838]|uniref:PD-(D/E)XK nuclease family protein n=1 Tax=Lentzea sp. NPDC051838 TaxID=3154849 RepID=UPI0034195D42
MDSPSVQPPVRHLVPLGAENRWSDLIAAMIESDPEPVAELLGLGDSPQRVVVQREVPVRKRDRIDLVITVGDEKRCVAEAKVLSGLGLDQLHRYRTAVPDAAHYVLISPERLPIDAAESSGWRSVYWEDLLRAMADSKVAWISETASAWLSYVDQAMPRLSADTRWNDLRDREPFVIAMRARMAWVYRRLRPPSAVEHDLVSSSAGQSWVARLYTPAKKTGYWIYVEAEERLSVRNYPKFAGDPRWGSVIGPSVKVCLMQKEVQTSAGFDWAYLHSLWPTMAAARKDWVTSSAKPRAAHDRAAWEQMVAEGGPRHLGIGFGENQARQRGQCMFGARFQLPADATLGTIAAELNATTQLLLDLAAVPSS